jgi:iron transport multicopper oxidase
MQVWVTDPDYGLKAFRAIPDENGVLVPIKLPATLGNNKYQRPVFGDGRVFVYSNNNKLLSLGSPVNPALTCTGPVSFGAVEIGDTAGKTVTCTANTAISAVNGVTAANPMFKLDNSSLPTGPVAAGNSFSFPVTLDLAGSENPVVPGFISSSLTLSTINPVEFASSALVPVDGTATYEGPFLKVQPGPFDFGDLILYPDAADNGGLEATVLIENTGNSPLTFTGFAWKGADEFYTNLTSSGELGAGFTSTEFPAVGSTLQPGQAITVDIVFFETDPGSYSSSVTIWSDGGSATVKLFGSANSPPIVSMEISDGKGGWTTPASPALAFGTVLAGTTVTRDIRLCNSGGSVLTITISKVSAL